MTNIDDIRDYADALTKPRTNTEPIMGWTKNRNRVIKRYHTVVIPGLIQQLRDNAPPSPTGEPSAIVKGCRDDAPGNINAIGLLASITYGVAHRVLNLGLKVRDTPERNIRALVGIATTLQPDQIDTIRNDLRAWHNQAEIITRWRTAARELPVPCPECSTRGTLLARATDTPEAWCTNCQTRWDTSTIGLLARHVADYRGRTQ